MATLTLRSTKGAPLTFAELDSNFTDLNSEAVKNLTYVAPNLVITQGDDTSLSVNIRDIVTYSSLNANGDVGTGSTQVARGNHVHSGLHYSGTQELTMLDGRLSLGNGTVLSYGQNRNITKVGAGIEDFYIYLGRASPGTHSIKYYYQGHSSYNSIQLDFALDYNGGGTNGVSLHAGLNTVKLFKSAGATEVSSIHIVKRGTATAEVYIKHTMSATIPAGNIINVNWSVQSQGYTTDAFYFPTDPLYTLNAGNTVTNFIQEVTTTGHTNFISVGGDGNALTNLNWNAISGIPLTTSSTDTTANRITKVGDFGLGADAISINNFDIITDSGFYRNGSSTSIGIPVVSNVILMVHNERSNNYAVQTAVQINTNRSWNRSKSAGTWTSWVEILTESSTVNAATLDNLDSTQFLRSDTSDQMNGQLYGGFGAMTTNGTKDWNHITNARSGNGYTLLRGSDSVNGPSTSIGFWHSFSFEYNAKDGTGNMTQYAIPFQDGLDTYFRVRVSAVWGAWRKILTDQNIPTYAVPPIGGSFYASGTEGGEVSWQKPVTETTEGNWIMDVVAKKMRLRTSTANLNEWAFNNYGSGRCKVTVNELEVDTPKTYNDASTQTITRQGVSTYISRWTAGGATYTLNEATFITGDKVYVTRMWDRVGTLTITSGQVIYLPDTSSALSQTLAVLGTVCFEYIGNAWMARAA